MAMAKAELEQENLIKQLSNKFGAGKIMSLDSDYVAFTRCPHPQDNENSNEYIIEIIHMPTQKQIASLSGHQDKVTCVYAYPNGHLLLSGSNDKTVRLWDLTNSKCLQIYLHAMPIAQVSFGEGGLQKIVTYDSKTRYIWDTLRGIILDKTSLSEALAVPGVNGLNFADWCYKTLPTYPSPPVVTEFLQNTLSQKFNSPNDDSSNSASTSTLAPMPAAGAGAKTITYNMKTNQKIITISPNEKITFVAKRVATFLTDMELAVFINTNKIILTALSNELQKRNWLEMCQVKTQILPYILNNEIDKIKELLPMLKSKEIFLRQVSIREFYSLEVVESKYYKRLLASKKWDGLSPVQAAVRSASCYRDNSIYNMLLKDYEKNGHDVEKFNKQMNEVPVQMFFREGMYKSIGVIIPQQSLTISLPIFQKPPAAAADSTVTVKDAKRQLALSPLIHKPAAPASSKPAAAAASAAEVEEDLDLCTITNTQSAPDSSKPAAAASVAVLNTAQAFKQAIEQMRQQLDIFDKLLKEQLELNGNQHLSSGNPPAQQNAPTKRAAAAAAAKVFNPEDLKRKATSAETEMAALGAPPNKKQKKQR